MDIKDFLRESIKENEREAKEYLLKEKAKQIYSISAKNGLPPLLKDKTLSNFKSDENYQAYKAACEFVSNFPDTNGLLLSGDIGVGKSHLAAAITNDLNKKLYSTYFGNVIDIISFFRSTYRGDSNINERDLIGIITEDVDLLVLDDLGKENSTEYTLSLLYQIINKLYENKKPIIITTNYNSVDLSRKLGERGQAIISRISYMCSPVKMSGKDRRISNGI